jgi:DNA processing protein
MPEDPMYWMALAELPGVGPVAARALVERFGGAKAALDAPASDVADVAGVRADTLDALPQRAEYVVDAKRTLDQLLDDGFDVIAADSPAYPAALRDLNDAPLVLYTLGQLPNADARCFAVAGSTAPSDRGRSAAALVGRELAAAGWTVVSGYAEGIDSTAHLGALEAGGTTLMILPMGVRAFKLRAQFAPFRAELGGRVVLMSECPPAQGWSSRAAVMRDRLIAAMGRALLVVEARPESGTMITFRHAQRLGRPAYVIDYRDAPPEADGNRQAIRAGGIPVPGTGALRALAQSTTLPNAAPRGVQGQLF